MHKERIHTSSPLPELAYDMSLYVGVPEVHKEETIVEDTAGLIIEAGDGPLEERINPRRFRVVDGQVIDSKGNTVQTYFGDNSELAQKETAAANMFYGQLLEGADLSLSISPPGGSSPYSEGRINVGYRVGQTIELYGIPTHMNPSELLRLAIGINEFSDQPFTGTDPDMLRETAIPLTIPLLHQGNPWDFLAEYAHLDSDAWQIIKECLPWERKEEALIDARAVFRTHESVIRQARTRQEHIHAGALMEQGMAQRGWKLGKIGCPGSFNSDLVAGNEFAKDSFGNVRSVEQTDQYGSLTFSCPHCGKENKREPNKLISNCQHCNGDVTC